MINTKGTSEKLNLLGCYNRVMKDTKHVYKAEYNRMFPTKMSSSSFLSLYTLFILDKKDQPLYGREILAELKKAVNANVWNPSHGTHYPVLKELMKDGYIENVKTISDKKYYAITESGRKELKLRQAQFEPMLREALKFFSNILDVMYPAVV